MAIILPRKPSLAEELTPFIELRERQKSRELESEYMRQQMEALKQQRELQAQQLELSKKEFDERIRQFNESLAQTKLEHEDAIKYQNVVQDYYNKQLNLQERQFADQHESYEAMKPLIMAREKAEIERTQKEIGAIDTDTSTKQLALMNTALTSILNTIKPDTPESVNFLNSAVAPSYRRMYLLAQGITNPTADQLNSVPLPTDASGNPDFFRIKKDLDTLMNNKFYDFINAGNYKEAAALFKSFHPDQSTNIYEAFGLKDIMDELRETGKLSPNSKKVLDMFAALTSPPPKTTAAPAEKKKTISSIEADVINKFMSGQPFKSDQERQVSFGILKKRGIVEEDMPYEKFKQLHPIPGEKPITQAPKKRSWLAEFFSRSKPLGEY